MTISSAGGSLLFIFVMLIFHNDIELIMIGKRGDKTELLNLFLSALFLNKKMKKAAMPIANNKVSEYLCGYSQFVFYDIDTRNTSISENEVIDFSNAVQVRLWIQRNGITDIILHRIKKELIGVFTSERINLFVGVPMISAGQIIEAYRCGKLESDKNIISEITN